MGPGEKPVRRVVVSEPVRPVARKPAGGLRWPGSQRVGSGGQEASRGSGGLEASRWAQVSWKPAGGLRWPGSQQVGSGGLEARRWAPVARKPAGGLRRTRQCLAASDRVQLIHLKSVSHDFKGRA